MLIQMHMDRLVVLSSFEQFTDVSEGSCSELCSLGVRLRELQPSVTKCCLCKALLREFNSAVKHCQGDSNRCFKQLGVVLSSFSSVPIPSTICEENTGVEIIKKDY